MAADWQRLCRGAGFVVSPPEVEVRFAHERGHRVTVVEVDDGWRIVGIVVRRAVAADLPDLAVRIWQLNRSTSLVGFRLDERGRLVGEARVPRDGITAQEFRTYVRAVAAECDRLEYVLTGKDAE